MTQALVNPVERTSRPPVVALLGPTAAGKTALSLAIAPALNGEIVSADSRQVYRYLDIGTAKPTSEERRRVPHHLLDIVDPEHPYTVAQYQRDALAVIDRLFAAGKLPLLVGGTGLYIRAVVDGLLIPPVPPQPGLRAELEQVARQQGLEALVRDLTRLDPVGAQQIDTRNPRRLIRAIEVSRVSGRPFSSWRQNAPPAFRTLQIGLTLDRAVLHARIEARVDDQMATGLVDEVRGLLTRGYGCELPSLSGLAYREICWYLQGKVSLGEAVRMYKAATRQYAKRQYTWFRADKRIRWLHAGDLRADEVARLIQEWCET